MADESTATAESAGIPQLDFTTFPNQIFWLGVFLLILFLIVNRIAIPQIESIAKSRKSRIENDLEEASRATAEAEAIRKKTAELMAAVKSDADGIAAETRAKILAMQDKEIIRVGDKILALTAESETRINAIRAVAPEKIQEIVVSVAPDIVRMALPSQSESASGLGDT